MAYFRLFCRGGELSVLAHVITRIDFAALCKLPVNFPENTYRIATSQPYSLSGSAVLPASVIKVFIHFSRCEHVQVWSVANSPSAKAWSLHVSLVAPHCGLCNQPHPARAKVAPTPSTQNQGYGKAQQDYLTAFLQSCFWTIFRYTSTSYLPVCSLTSIARTNTLSGPASWGACLFN
jgi:hypothetical protein